MTQSALELYNLARSRGLSFRLIGLQQLRIDGPAEVIRALNDEIDQRAAGLIAVVEEFSIDSAPVVAAQALLRGSTDAWVQRA